MKPYKDRPFEIAHNLNPIFCSMLLCDATEAFQAGDSSGLDYPLIYLVLPIVLHKATREVMPRSIRTRMHVWLEANPQVRIGFPERVKNLKEISIEAVYFGIQQEFLMLDSAGRFKVRRHPLRAHKFPTYSNPSNCRNKARLLGRWFETTMNNKAIFIMWGIRP